MLSNEIAKTKSAPKRWYGWVLLVSALALVVVVAVWHTHAKLMTVRLGDQTYILTRTVTKSQREKGLSGTASLGHDRGMFFSSNHETEACFWMKDMHYSLDIIWLDQNKKVVSIERDLAPGTYPQTFCHPGQYIIEINAGQAAKNDIRTGQKVSF